MEVDLTIVVGARPNFMKAAPIWRHLKDRMSVRVVDTGQHQRSMVSACGMDVDVRFDPVSGNPGARLGHLVRKLAIDFTEHDPMAVLVVGDVDSTLAGALAANKTDKLLFHYEAGLRSGDRSMPEEVNRILVDEMADLHLCTTHFAKANLAPSLGADSPVIVGNTMIDTLWATPKLDESEVRARFKIERGGPYVVVTAHRPSLVDDERRLEEFVDALKIIDQEIQVIWITHPRVRMPRNAYGFNIWDPCEYPDMISLVKHAACVVTDSGGLQEETTALGVPCVTFRNTTERPETLIANGGTSLLHGTDAARLPQSVQRLYNYKRGIVPVMPTWMDGKAGERAADAIWRAMGGNPT